MYLCSKVTQHLITGSSSHLQYAEVLGYIAKFPEPISVMEIISILFWGHCDCPDKFGASELLRVCGCQNYPGPISVQNSYFHNIIFFYIFHYTMSVTILSLSSIIGNNLVLLYEAPAIIGTVDGWVELRSHMFRKICWVTDKQWEIPTVCNSRVPIA